MSIKRILLPVNEQDDIKQTGDFAFILAFQHDAEVQGIFTQHDNLKDYWLDNFGLEESVIGNLETKARHKAVKEAKASKLAFEKHAASYANVKSNYFSMLRDNPSSFVDYSFCADLTVLKNSTNIQDKYWLHLTTQMLEQSARPVLMVPSRPVSKDLGNRIVIAWNRTSEASRAIAAAMPLIEKAKSVVIVLVDGDTNKDIQSLNLLNEHIALHTNSVENMSIKSNGQDIGHLLIDTTAEKKGSILVMGAYSHRRLREQIFGGVTKSVLHHADVPIFMMH